MMNLRLSRYFLRSLLCMLTITVIDARLAAVPESVLGQFEFERGTSGKALKKGGIEVSFSRFKSKDGTVVEREVEDHKTAKAARAALQQEIKHSSKVMQDGYRYDAHGNQVGRKVELFLSGSANVPEQIEIAWTDGQLLYLLRSESSKHVLDFERQVYRKPSTEDSSK